MIKWPTATRDEFGTGRIDYSLGLVVGKSFAHFDLDGNIFYTIVGNSSLNDFRNTIEAGLNMELPLSEIFDLVGEVHAINAAGRTHGQSSTISGISNRDAESEISFTIGVAESITDAFRLEQGLTLQLDGSWQAIVAWELTLGESD